MLEGVYVKILVSPDHVLKHSSSPATLLKKANTTITNLHLNIPLVVEFLFGYLNALRSAQNG